MSVAGWAVTIAGVPWVFTTSDMGTLTSSSALWWGGESGVSYADGWLTWPRGTITERAKPLEGELDVSPLPFELHDAPTSAGGSPLLTGLAGRDSVGLTSTPVASTVTASATSITVGDGGLFSAPCFAWIEGEAVRVTSVVGNVLTVTRGRLGTKAVAHTVDATIGRFPEAFTAVPWTTRRKVHLWRVDAGAASLVWAGYAVRAPQLADDGARYTVSCDPLWSVQAANPIAGNLGSTRFAGYSDGRPRTSTSPPPILSTVVTLAGGTDPASGTLVRVVSNGSYRTLSALFARHQLQASTLTNAGGQRVVMHFARSGPDGFTIDADSSNAFMVRLQWLDRDPVNLQSSVRGTLRSVSGAVSGVPTSLAMILVGAGSGTYLVTSLSSLPSSWSPTATTEASLTTTEEPVLRAHVSDEWTLMLTSVATADDGDEYGPSVEGRYVWAARKPGLRPLDGGRAFVLANPPPLKVAYRVRTDHWMLGLKNSVLGLCEDAGANDWDWTSVYASSTPGPALRATAGLRTAREWVFDGRRTLGSVVTECCLLHGCTPVTRSGRLAIHAWGWPSARESAVETLTSADIIGKPTWARWADGIANRLLLKSDSLNVDATLQQSRARYGPGRQVSVELAGIEDQALPVDDPFAFAREVAGRLELWSEPLGVASMTLKGSLWGTLELGAIFRVTEWMLPRGNGGRGLSGALAVVVGRTLDLGNASMRVDALLFPRVSYPYGPCAKVASVVTSTVAQLATGYVGGTTSYSGGNDATTFETGDVVELVERDTTTLWTEQLTVASVDTGLGRLTFTSSMSGTAQTKIGAGWVDVRHADYAAVTASQASEWMFVADDATSVIDGTAEPQRLIAP
jgi:hypothetical protein